eukprot:1064254-Prorocentrum_minimum.AAC.1
MATAGVDMATAGVDTATTGVDSEVSQAASSDPEFPESRATNSLRARPHRHHVYYGARIVI